MIHPSSEPIWPLVIRQLRAGQGVPALAGTCVLFVLLLNVTPLMANDFWTQIKVGEIIRETTEIPSTVLFAFDPAGESRFVAYEWLPSLGVSLVHSLFGVEGAIVTRAALALIVFSLLVLLSLKINRDLLLSLFVAIACFLVMSNRFFIRPEMFSFVFGLLELNLLQAFVRTGNPRCLAGLIPVALIWANCHGSFPVGIALAFLFSFGELVDTFRIRRFGAVFAEIEGERRGWMPFALAGAAMAGASLVNPFGWDLIEKVFTLTDSSYIRASIGEWMPVYAPNFTGERAFVLYLLLLLLVVDSLVQRPQSRSARLYLLAGFFFLLSVDANRHVAWFAVAAAYVLAHTLVGSPRLEEPRERNASWLWFAVIMGCTVTIQCGNVRGHKPGLHDESPLSAEAIQFVRDSGYSGNVFNSYVYGGKLAYHFYPNIRITIDDRIDAYGEDYYRNFQRFDGLRRVQLASPGDFLRYFEQNELNLVVVEVYTVNVWSNTGRMQILEGAGWNIVYRGSETWILRRPRERRAMRGP